MNDVETNEDGSITIDGQVSDDEGTEGISIELGGGVEGDITLNPDGTFEIDIPNPPDSGMVEITITDADGNVTTMEININT